jgi:hypothetical protein
MIAVSVVGGEALTPDLGEHLARDLAGLALVCMMDEAASWAVTQGFGREWSCFNQGVRLYWPLRQEKPNAYDHPLWTTSHLLERAGSRTTASQQLRNQLRRQMLALSTYTLTEPPMLIDIRQKASAKRLKELRDRAESDGAWQALAEEYDKENQTLKQRAAELEVSMTNILDGDSAYGGQVS